MITLNGKPLDNFAPTISALLDAKGYSKAAVAVECNGEIIPREEYEHTAVNDGDIIEILNFVGGGC